MTITAGTEKKVARSESEPHGVLIEVVEDLHNCQYEVNAKGRVRVRHSAGGDPLVGGVTSDGMFVFFTDDPSNGINVWALDFLVKLPNAKP